MNVRAGQNAFGYFFRDFCPSKIQKVEASYVKKVNVNRNKNNSKNILKLDTNVRAGQNAFGYFFRDFCPSKI